MNVVTHYESTVIDYDNSTEMSKHIEEMEKLGWKCVSQSYGKLRARYRLDYEREDEE